MALGDPSACLRFLGEAFDSMLEISLCDIAEACSEITPEGGIDAMLTEPDHAWDEMLKQINMGACEMRGAKGAEKVRAAAEMEMATYAAVIGRVFN